MIRICPSLTVKLFTLCHHEVFRFPIHHVDTWSYIYDSRSIQSIQSGCWLLWIISSYTLRAFWTDLQSSVRRNCLTSQWGCSDWRPQSACWKLRSVSCTQHSLSLLDIKIGSLLINCFGHRRNHVLKVGRDQRIEKVQVLFCHVMHGQ